MNFATEGASMSPGHMPKAQSSIRKKNETSKMMFQIFIDPLAIVLIAAYPLLLLL